MPPVAPASARDLDAYRERADRFIATLDEEYYLHFAGHKERLELEAIYGEFADLTTIEQARSIGCCGERQLRDPRALAIRLRGVPRPVDQGARREARPQGGRADDDRRRRGDSLPDDQADDHERGGPGQARTPRARPERARRRALEPAVPRVARARSRGGARARRGQLLRALQELRLRPRRAGRAVPRVSELDRAAAHQARRQALSRPRRDAALRGRALGQGPHDARDDVGRRLPRRQDAACAPRERSRASASTSTHRRTSTSTSRTGRSRTRARSACRSRCPTR